MVFGHEADATIGPMNYELYMNAALAEARAAAEAGEVADGAVAVLDEALKLAEIDVAVTTSMVPVKFAKEHIDEASKLIGERLSADADKKIVMDFLSTLESTH